MAVTADKPTPYAPASVIIDLIERHRNRGLPSPVDSDVLARAGVSDSLIPRTLQALQTLDLIDDSGTPTETLEGIRKAQEAEYQASLAAWLKSVYADVFSYVDPSQDDETAVRDAFRSYNPIGQQARMVTLFIGLCAAAGLAPDKPVQTRAPRTHKPTTTTLRGGPKVIRTTRVATPGIPPALSGLLDSLPNEGKKWTKDERDRFLKTFEAVLDFCFPIVEAGETETAASQEDDDAAVA